jgi:hypothetical protein
MTLLDLSGFLFFTLATNPFPILAESFAGPRHCVLAAVRGNRSKPQRRNQSDQQTEAKQQQAGFAKVGSLRREHQQYRRALYQQHSDCELDNSWNTESVHRLAPVPGDPFRRACEDGNDSTVACGCSRDRSWLIGKRSTPIRNTMILETPEA